MVVRRHRQRAACGVVDSLRHSNAEYRGTSRELGDNGSAQYRPQVSFQNEFLYILCIFKILKKIHAYRIHPVEWLQEGFTAGFHVPLNLKLAACTYHRVSACCRVND